MKPGDLILPTAECNVWIGSRIKGSMFSSEEDVIGILEPSDLVFLIEKTGRREWRVFCRFGVGYMHLRASEPIFATGT